jgi:hypothetical protein
MDSDSEKKKSEEQNGRRGTEEEFKGKETKEEERTRENFTESCRVTRILP